MSNGFMKWAKEERKKMTLSNDTQYFSSAGLKGSELYEWMTSGINTAGVTVNEKTALAVSAVYACVSLIGGAIACTPLHLYRSTSVGRERENNNLTNLLNRQPAPHHSAAVFRESLMASVLLHGDGFAEIKRRGAGVESIEWLPSKWVEPIEKDGRILYIIQKDNASSGGRYTRDQDDIIHVPGLGFDGLRGMSQLRYCLRNSSGIAQAADEYSAAFFANNQRADFILKTPGDLSPEQQKVFRETWASYHQGPLNSSKPAVLTGGMDIEQISINAEDAQLLSTRKYQTEEIARIFGVPLWMIGSTEKTTSYGTGIEQMSIGFVKYTLSRWLVKLEQELNRKLYPRKQDYFFKFNTAGLERGDIKSRHEAYRIAAGRAGEPAWLTVNEIRRLEDRMPIEGGDKLPTFDNEGTKQNDD